MDSKVGLQNAIQDLLLCGDARNDFVNLSYYGTKEGGSTEEKEDAEDLSVVMKLNEPHMQHQARPDIANDC